MAVATQGHRSLLPGSALLHAGWAHLQLHFQKVFNPYEMNHGSTMVLALGDQQGWFQPIPQCRGSQGQKPPALFVIISLAMEPRVAPP